jgi:bile acid:Na+ symporter, BASS family
MHAVRRICLGIGLVGLIPLAFGVATGAVWLWHPAAVLTCVGLAIGLGSVPRLRSYQFTAWILTGVLAAMIYPAHFLQIGPVNLRDKRLILLIMQLVMFGMGTQIRLSDFVGVARMPRAVAVGILLHFTIMPLVGFSLANAFDFSPEVAAGIVLIGSCSSGLASNVINFIAGGNLPLSITITSVSTLLAPVATPLAMKLLAGRMITVDGFAMMVEIFKLIVVPIGAAMLDDYLEHASKRGRRIAMSSAAAAGILLLIALLGGWSYVVEMTGEDAAKYVVLIGFLLGAIVVGAIYHILRRMVPVIPKLMPTISMLGIVYVTTVTVAAGRDQLLVIGPLLLIAVMAHNLIGFALGYWLGRAFQLDKNSARTVAIEVGLQNGGMATTIAASLNQLGTLGLAAAVFSPWQNFAGSILANHWRRRPVKGNASLEADLEATLEKTSL